MRLSGLITLTLTATGLASCIPVVGQNRPSWSFVVSTPDGQPIPEARVTVAKWRHPYGLPVESWTETVDRHGRAAFHGSAQLGLAMPLLIHGVASYSWRWCVEAPGRQTVVSEGIWGRRPVPRPVRVALAAGDPGASASCQQRASALWYDPLAERSGTP